MSTQISIQESIGQLIAFRQELYTRVFTARRDALMEILDALLTIGPFPSFARLSLSERFQRRWPSLYAGVEDGHVNSQALRTLLVRQLPTQGICFFPLDTSPWPRPRGRVLEDLQYVYQASSAINGGTVTIGYPYSWLEWAPEPHSSWSLPIDVRRVPSHQTALEVGAEQVRELARLRADCSQTLNIVVGDGRYGAVRFLQQVQGLPVGLVVRLRRDRVLYRPAEPSPFPRRGKPRRYGARFDFRDPATWGPPDEVVELEDEAYGRVRLERWKGLLERRAGGLAHDVVRACIHQERSRPPEALWLAWLPPAVCPTGVTVTAQTIWEAYVHRWPVEPALRFRKEELGWTRPRFQRAETGDTWTLLVAVACWMLYLARPLVEDCPLPWQKPQAHRTPQRVRQGLKPIFVLIGSPVREPRARGKPPGWPKGKRRTPKERHEVVKKRVSAAQRN